MSDRDSGWEPMTIIGFLAVGATIVLVVLFLSQALLSTPNTLYPMVIVLLLLLVLGLVKVSYPKPSPFYAGEYHDVADENDIPAGRGDSEADQYLAYLELKHLLIERVIVRRSMMRDDWDRAAGDDRALYRLLGDEDLLRLARLSERSARIPRGYRIEGVVLGSGFERRYDHLLGKVEGWQ